MKRILFSLLLVGALAAPALARETTMNIQIRSAQLRATPSFLGAVVGTADYGASVTILEEKTGWYRVSTSDGATGWLNNSALTTKKIVMQAGASDVSTAASGQELAMAGKGFNSSVEADFKKQNKGIDFTWIDRMEKVKVTPAQMADFLRAGQVKPTE